MSYRRNAVIVATAGLALALGAGIARAQIVIFDPAVTFKNAAIAALKEVLLDTLGNEADRLRQMAKRLSAFTDLRKYWIADDDTPKWRIHVFFGDQFLFANPYNAALNYGDPSGAAFEAVARARVDASAVLGALDEVAPEAEAALIAQLATLDAADSSLIASTDQTGQLRYNGRKETAAIEALQDDALDPSTDQSATAVLDKISGAGLIRAQQQQARMQFLAGVVEQLLVDNKRSRDTEAATMNMQLQRLRWGAAANQSLIAGAADALRTWRQP
jgi:hypothetical protein